MNTIDSIQIKGFWGSHEVNIKSNDSYNFIIGPNGSGKSTALRLVAGALLAEKSLLSSHEFSHIKITLKDSNSRKKPYIEIIKSPELEFFHCDYKIFESSSEKPYLYTLSDLESYDYRSRNNYFIRSQLAGREAAGKTLTQHLKELISLTWLSVQRTNNADPKSLKDPLDNRLEDFSNRLVRYLSSLGKKINSLNERFQEQVFLSLLNNEPSLELGIAKAINLESGKSALKQIYAEFGVDKKNYIKKVESHFEVLERLQDRPERLKDVTQKEIRALLTLGRINETVAAWEEISNDKNTILKPKEEFIELLNKLMQRKILSINERNEIIIRTSSGKNLTPSQLSSGEKQILIILGEALLQEGETYIYMADEPEISLHVAWQESLAKNIKILNPSAQIIFATHSPDVVGNHHDSIIEMGRCIKDV